MPAREESIDKERSFISSSSRRERRAESAAAAGKTVKPRGPVAQRPAKKEAKMSVYDRIKGYPGQPFFCAGDRKMGCHACGDKILPLHKYRIDDHIKGKKHIAGARKMLQRTEADKVSKDVDY